MNNTKIVKSRDDKNDIATLAKGGAITIFGKIAKTGIQYIYFIIISRILGVESFGLYMLGFTIISLSEVVSRFGLDNAVIRYVSLYHGVNDIKNVKEVILKALTYSFGISIIISIFLFFCSNSLSETIFSKPELEGIIKVLSFSIPPLTVMAVALAATQGLKIMKYTTYSENIFRPLSNLIFVIIIFITGFHLGGVMFSWIISSFLALILSLFYLYKSFSNIEYKKNASNIASEGIRAGKLFGYSSPLLLIILLTSLLTWTDTLMLGYFGTSNEVGIYNAAARTAMLTGIILISFNTIFAPMISDLYNRSETQQLQAMFKLSSRWIHIFTLPLFILVVLFSKEVMIMFGEEFINGWIVLVIIAFTYFINASTGPVGNMLIMSGHQRVMMYNSIGVFVLNIIVNYILIPEYGMYGAAIASSISIIAYNLLMLAEVYILLKMHPYNFRFLSSFFIGVIIFFFSITRLISLPLVLKFTIVVPLFIVIFSYFVYIFCINDEDKVVINMTKEKLKKIIG